MPIPIEAGSFTYTPECLSELPDAPVFTIRHGTRRDRHNYHDECRARRLRSHDQDDFRAAFIAELRSNSPSGKEAIELGVDALQRYFSADDELGAALKDWLTQSDAITAANSALPEGAAPTPLPQHPDLDFDPGERAKVEALMADIEDNSDKVGRMHRDNGRREREIRRAAIAVLLEGVSFDLPLTRNRDGTLTEDTVYALEDWLDTFSDAEEHRGGIAFVELGTKAMLSFLQTKEEEKNSPSPLPTDTEGNGSINPAVSPSSITTTSKGLPTSELEPVPTPAKSSAKATPT